jgi:hypothetical protein
MVSCGASDGAGTVTLTAQVLTWLKTLDKRLERYLREAGAIESFPIPHTQAYD